MNSYPYRGKGIFSQKWERGYLVDNIYGGQPVIVTSSELNDGNTVEFEYEHIKPESIGKNTYLKDLNKNEIFTGDIVQFEDVECDSEGYHDRIIVNRGIVEESSGCGVYFTNRQTVEMGDLYIDNEKVACTVIGNIFDNPELLDIGCHSAI